MPVEGGKVADLVVLTKTLLKRFKY